MSRRRLPGRGAGRAALAALALAGCREAHEEGARHQEPAEPTAAGASARPNVLLIVADTLRADHLSPYGYARDTSPNLARLAARGTLFENVLSQFQETRPSHVSLMTGLYPGAHGVTDNDHGPCPQGVTTLAETLAAGGFATAAVVGNALLMRDFGLDQGFDHYDDVMTSREPNRPTFGEKRADRAVDAALAWIRTRAGERPFFLFLHLQDPHGPYVPPPPFAARFTDDGRLRTGKVVTERQIPPYQRLPGRFDHDHYVAQYDGEIAFADAELGRLFAALETAGLAERTLVLFTADHGEALGERGLYYLHHAPMVFEEILRLPLIVAGPGVAAGRRVERLVQAVDLLPTLLERLDLEVPAEVQGRSFLELLEPGGTPPPLSAGPDGPGGLHGPDESDPILPADIRFSGGRSGLAVARTQRWKLWTHPTGRRLYDLANDPGEERDVAAENGAIVQALERWLAHRQAADAALRARVADGAAYTPEQAETDRRRLKELGYAEGDDSDR